MNYNRVEIEYFLEETIAVNLKNPNFEFENNVFERANLFFNELEKICPCVVSDGYSQDTYSAIQICLQNKFNVLSSPRTCFGHEHDYWKFPAVLGISTIGGITTIREEANMRLEDVSLVHDLINKFE